uniref:(California timema) hypothetical protein n=1 Tax=Timema californicum TaxID=61474 RepID=A0A7R9JAE9_TIMCA|nr:unnamed protein product [Timema californicum]
MIQATIQNGFVKCFRVKKNEGSGVTDIDGRGDDDSTQDEDKVQKVIGESMVGLEVGLGERRTAQGFISSNETILLKHIEQLETERTAALNEARSYLIKGTRNMAKTSLRKKHELEHIIEKKVMALENVRILLNQLNDSGLDAQVLESYKKGASVLKAVLKDSGLTEESVSSTMLQLEEDNKSHLSHARYTAMTRNTRTLDSPVRSLDSQVRSLDTQVHTLDTQVRSLDTQVHTLDTPVHSLDTQVHTLDTQVRSLDTPVRTLDTPVHSHAVHTTAARATRTPGLFRVVRAEGLESSTSRIKRIQTPPDVSPSSPHTPSAPLIPQSSEKVAAHPPDKEGDRENKERRHKGQQREHAGRDYLCKVIHKVLDVNQEIQAILSQPIGSSTDKDLEEELAALLKSSGSSGPSDNTLHYTGGEFEGNHKEAPSPPFTTVYILDEEKARDLTKGPLIVTRLAGR